MIIFFDGICVFCDSFIHFVVKRDKKNIFRLCHLQSDIAKVLAQENEFFIDQKNPQSLILLKEGKVLEKSSAVITILAKLGGIWVLINLFWLVPKKIRDFFYDFFGRHRYKWFGKKACDIDSVIFSHVIFAQNDMWGNRVINYSNFFMKYVIYGLGISGISTARYLSAKGFDVVVTDDNLSAIENAKNKLLQQKIRYLQSSEIENECDENTVIVFAPGIPLYFPKPHKILEIAKKTKAKLLCDVELFYLFNSQKKFLGITGTNGKSTTTALTGFIFEQLGFNVKIGGNIGVPCFDLPEAEIYVFETSSYHLDLMEKTHFSVASLTNITPDHIDRHGTFENYVEAKKRIFMNQNKNDFAVIGIDNEFSHKIFDELVDENLIPISTKKIVENGVAIFDGILHNRINGAKSDLSLEGLILKGEHNMQNIAIAFANVYCHILQQKISDISENMIVDAIKKFKGLRHRMQYLGNVTGVSFINDSKATNAESTENALKSYDHIFWILGGKAKEGGIDILQPYFNKITKAYLIGDASEEFAKILEKNLVEFEKCGDLQTAIKKSFFDAKNSGLKEKNILLSPACASFDQWKNFEERGDFFCKAFDEINQA